MTLARTAPGVAEAEARYGEATAAFDAACDRARAAWRDLGQAQSTGTIVVAHGYIMRPWKHGMPCLTCDNKHANACDWFFTDAAFAGGVNAQDRPYCDSCVQSRDPELHTTLSMLIESWDAAWESHGDLRTRTIDELMHTATDPFDRAAFLALPALIAGLDA